MSSVGNVASATTVKLDSLEKKAEKNEQNFESSFVYLQTNDLNETRPALKGNVPTRELGISYTRENHDMHWYSDGEATTHGIKLEGEKYLAESKNGVFKLSKVGSSSLNFNSESINLEGSSGLKLQAGFGEVANVYATGSITGNIGFLDKSFTAGLGARAAVGAELGPVYVETFREAATNYNAKGYSVGARFCF